MNFNQTQMNSIMDWVWLKFDQVWLVNIWLPMLGLIHYFIKENIRNTLFASSTFRRVLVSVMSLSWLRHESWCTWGKMDFSQACNWRSYVMACKSWKIGPKVYMFVVCNLHQSSSSLMFLVHLLFIIISVSAAPCPTESN